MHLIFPVLLVATRGHAYWYPNSYTRTPSPDEDCYSQTNDPYSITCYATNDFVYAPCSDLFVPTTPAKPNNFTYYAICTFPDPYMYHEGDFWSDIITVDLCENYWDACISDNPLAKYDDTIKYGRRECREVTNSACGKYRIDKSSDPGSEPEDTTVGAFDLGPYSTVSQVTAPRISMTAETGSASTASTSRAAMPSTTGNSRLSKTSSTSPAMTASGTSKSTSSSAIAQVTITSKAGTKTEAIATSIYVGLLLSLLLVLLI